MAQRHHRRRWTTLVAVILFGLVIGGGVLSARSVQLELSGEVQRALGATIDPVEIIVDGRDVTLRTTGTLSDAQRAAASAVTHLASLTIVTTP